MSLGGSSSKSKSKSETSKDAFNLDVSQGRTFLNAQQLANQQALVDQFMPQLDTSSIVQGLQGAQGLQQQLGSPGFLQSIQGLQQRMAGGLNQLQGSLRNNVPYLNELRGAASGAREQLASFANQYNPYIDSQIQSFGQDIGRNLRENILPGIGGNAQMSGQRGGSRQGVAEGLAAQGAQRQFAQGAANMRSQAYGQQQAAAQSLAGLTNQQYGQFAGLQQAGQAQLAGMGLQGAAQLGGLQQAGYAGALSSMPQIAQAQLMAQLQPFQIGAGVIGAPSVLSAQDSFGIGAETARGTSTSRGSSAGLSMGL